VVRRSAEHLSGLIDGLLDISKIEAGRFHLDRVEIHTAQFFDQMIDMFRLQAAAKGLEFRHEPAPRMPPVVYADESRLRQILINLLSNAIKFTESGHVTFRVGYRNQVATFAIEDSGIGIAPGDLERIFLPFARAHGTRVKATGTGLGLTITKLLTQVMGGDITVASEPGKGTLFTVKLLLSAVARPRVASTMEERVRGYVGPPQTVLIVDDDEVQRNLLGELLGPLGFNVAAASGGRECLALVPRLRPNLILLDIAMPDMDGWQVAQRIRAARERPAIMVLSANAIEAERLAGAERLHDDYMMKPIDLRQLLKKIHALLDIEWIYEEAKPQLAAERGAPGAVPPAADIVELIGLGEIGHVRRIHEKLNAIVEAAPGCAGLVAQLRSHVKAFDLKRYVATLEAIRNGHA
jgi:CheY-like chemotaxis protein/anti-sigma regulatory factor (Ser/Thr protein kinase)